ncbi:MAG: VOC family protein [Planctomycetes bacterium]|nr:VOC family protein [Planctomycetota bacterium]
MTQSTATQCPAPAASDLGLGLRHLDHMNLSVSNLAETIDWYARVFGFEVVERAICDDGTPMAILRSGEAMLCCYEHSDWKFVSNVERRERGIHGINHFALRITDRAAFLATVEREQVALTWGGAAIEYPNSTSWYVVDPTGYGIEIALWNDDRVAF